MPPTRPVQHRHKVQSSQLWGSAHLSNQNQNNQQSADALLQPQLPAGEVSAQPWQIWWFGSVVLADPCSLCARPWLSNEGNPYSSLAQAHRKEPLEQGYCQWGFDPSLSCRCCILETQFYASSLHKHWKSCKKSGPRNQLPSVDAVKPIKQRSSLCAILRGTSSSQGNHCQCWKKKNLNPLQVKLLQKDFSKICPTLLPIQRCHQHQGRAEGFFSPFLKISFKLCSTGVNKNEQKNCSLVEKNPQ